MSKLLILVLVASVVLVIWAFVFAIVTQWAWSGSVGEIFHLPDLTFMQAFWLNLLGGMLCKGSSASASKS